MTMLPFAVPLEQLVGRIDEGRDVEESDEREEGERDDAQVHPADVAIEEAGRWAGSASGPARRRRPCAFRRRASSARVLPWPCGRAGRHDGVPPTSTPAAARPAGSSSGAAGWQTDPARRARRYRRRRARCSATSAPGAPAGSSPSRAGARFLWRDSAPASAPRRDTSRRSRRR